MLSELWVSRVTHTFQCSEIDTYLMTSNTLKIQNVCDKDSSTTTGINVNGVFDAYSTAKIADTLTLSKASGTGLSLPSSSISVGGSTIVSSTSVTADSFQTISASFTATSSAVQCSVAATFTAFDSTMAGTFRLAGSAPSSSTDTGTAGQIAVDADYIYVCTATDTWKRVAIATW